MERDQLALVLGLEEAERNENFQWVEMSKINLGASEPQ